MPIGASNQSDGVPSLDRDERHDSVEGLDDLVHARNGRVIRDSPFAVESDIRVKDVLQCVVELIFPREGTSAISTTNKLSRPRCQESLRHRGRDRLVDPVKQDEQQSSRLPRDVLPASHVNDDPAGKQYDRNELLYRRYIVGA